MKRYVLGAGCALLAAVAVAAGITVSRAAGVGQLRDADGKGAMLQVQLTKVENGDQTRLRGGFSFQQRSRDPRSLVMVAPARNANGLQGTFTVDAQQKTATFEGPGQLRRFAPGGRPTVANGTVRLVVTDNKRRKTTGTPDAASLTFTPAEGEPFTFSGNVERGDFVVGQRTQDGP